MKSTLFLGIGGAGMRGLAYLLRERGETVVGYDDNIETTEISLSEAFRTLSSVHNLVYTDAALETHPLRIQAKQLGITQTPYHKALGEFSRDYQTIAVTGTHGKSSTTAFLAHICMKAGLDPCVLVGANMETLAGKHAQFGRGNYFIAEADEYRKHFLELTPAHCIITTIDFDHPDSFSSLEDTEQAYGQFLTQMQKGGTLVIPEDEQKRHNSIHFPETTIPVPTTDALHIRVPLPGTHMRMNAALAVTLAEKLGISRESAIDSLQTFPGLSRRFELLGTYNGCDIRSDYGHHPAEIAAALQGARETYPTQTILAVFEAHMPLRLRTFFDDFVAALSLADEIVIVPPFGPIGRDDNGIEEAVRLKDDLLTRGKHAAYNERSLEFLDHLESNTVAVLFSAGSLDAHVRKTVNKH